MKCVAIVVSGGRGRRMAAEVPKQYLDLGGRPILARTLAAVSAAPSVERIVLVAPQGDVAACREKIVKKYKFKKVARVVAGGQTRQDSVRAGLAVLEKMKPTPDVVLIHDGVRPFVTAAAIEKVIHVAASFGAALLAAPVKETVKFITDDGFVRGTPDRRWIYLAQTPQAFQFAPLLDAHRDAAAEGFVGTDDCQLIERLGGRVVIVEGDDLNIKITTQTDLLFARALDQEGRRK